jgi:hypothetical protein
MAIQAEVNETKSQSILMKEEDGDVIVSDMLIEQSEGSDKRIDNLLKEGVDYLTSFGDVNSDPNRLSSGT